MGGAGLLAVFKIPDLSGIGCLEEPRQPDSVPFQIFADVGIALWPVAGGCSKCRDVAAFDGRQGVNTVFSLSTWKA